MKDFGKDLSINQIIVFVVQDSKYASDLEEITAAVSKKSKSMCYVSLNKPYNVLEKSFSGSIDVKKMIFIDSVSGRTDSSQDNVIFISSPKALTELSITINEVLGKKIDVLLFDSISTLLIYHEPSMVIKFVHSIISKIRATDVKCVFLCLAEDAKGEMIKDVNMFVDKMIYL